ncbi:MAG: preprotein translocase subunit SecG [Gemmobacter sp.]|jgi:preprotein translocase subunit SecG
MENVILTIHLILALLLIGVVLLQRSEGGGLGMGGGGGAISARGAANALTKLTWIFAIGFIITSLTLTILAARSADSSSVVEQIGGSAPVAPATPTAPLGGGSLLPPPTADAPVPPPRADAPAEGTPATPEQTAPATPAPAPAQNN